MEQGNNILICAHGNSLRSLIMSLEEISPDEIVKVEIGAGEPILYSYSTDSSFQKKIYSLTSNPSLFKASLTFLIEISL